MITQNIDNLHQMAGSRRVLELHGSVYRNYCTKCGAFHDFSYMKHSSGIPRCEKCGGVLKPDVVLYEEALNQQTLSESVRAISEAEVLIIGGTSLSVYPAASLVDYFRGKYLVVINKDKTPRDSMADLVINAPIGEVCSYLADNNRTEGEGILNDRKFDYEVGDIVTLKKQHPCGSKEWEILRVGADFRLKLYGLRTSVMLARRLVEKNTRDLKKMLEIPAFMW